MQKDIPKPAFLWAEKHCRPFEYTAGAPPGLNEAECPPRYYFAHREMADMLLTDFSQYTSYADQ